ncbi:MAG: HNH endonuclease [Methylococcaceae bacterium]|nr:HNH endonuclease [Methylococcaceae bacterium]
METQGVLLPGYTTAAQRKFRKRALQVIQNLKTRMLKAGFTLDGFNRDALLEILAAGIGNPCPYCGESIKTRTMSPDHPTPISKGGDPWVIQVCCQRDNRRKGEMDDAEYRKLLTHLETYCPETKAYILRMLSAGAAFPMMQRGILSMKARLTFAGGQK